MPREDAGEGTHGYYFLDSDGKWRFMTPYRAEFRDAISEEIPYESRTFDWRYKVWVVENDYVDDALSIARRFYIMTQLFSVGTGDTRDERVMQRLTELEQQLQGSQALLKLADRKVAKAEARFRAAEEKTALLQAKLLKAERTGKGKISDHSGKDCLAVVRRNYPLEALFHLLPSAPDEVLRAAYRALSLLTHPDRHPTRKGAAEEEQKKINVAYGTLSKQRGM